MSKTIFQECDESVYALQVELLNEFHLNLRNANIKCLFYDKPKRRGGNIVLGTAEAVTPKINYLTDIDFIISIYKGTWNIMAEQERKALIDHEMSHCFVGEDSESNPVYKIIPHDLEEFKTIIERYGMWQDNIQMGCADIEEG